LLSAFTDACTYSGVVPLRAVPPGAATWPIFYSHQWDKVVIGRAGPVPSGPAAATPKM
jgi:hypothetical protein